MSTTQRISFAEDDNQIVFHRKQTKTLTHINLQIETNKSNHNHQSIDRQSILSPYLPDQRVRGSSLFQGFNLGSLSGDRYSLSPLKKKHNSIYLNKMFNKLGMGFPLSGNNLGKNKNEEMNIDDLEHYSQDELIELAILILQKPFHQRNQNDIKMLVKCTESVKFFADMISINETKTHEECCKYMAHKFYREGDVIFREGSEGSTFYIILQGSVSVNILEKHNNSSQKLESLSPKNKLPKVSVTESKKIQRTTTFQNEDSSPSRIRSSIAMLDKKGSLSSTKFREVMGNFRKISDVDMIKIKIMTKGQSFGELALLDNKPRSATIICEEKCHFAVLDKQYFVEILKEKEKKKLYSQIEFFASMKLFKSWSYNAVKKIFLNATESLYLKNMYVYKENDDSDDLYLIKSGEFRIVKDLVVDLKSYEEIDFPDLNFETLTKLNLSSKLYKHIHGFELGILGPGESLGEEELLSNKKRQYSVICTSGQGVLYVLNKKFLLKKILYDKLAKLNILKSIETKYNYRSNRIQEYINLNYNNKKKKHEITTMDFNPDKYKNNSIIRSKESSPEKTENTKTYFIPFQKKEKTALVSVSESIIDPMRIKKLFQEKSLAKLLNPNTPKKNLFIINAFLKENSINKKNCFLGRKKSEPILFENSSLNKINFSKKIDISTINEENFYGIVMPVSEYTVNNGLRNTLGDIDLKMKKKKMKKKKKESYFNSNKVNENNFIEKDIEKNFSKIDDIFNILKKRNNSVDFIFEKDRKLPLKYISNDIKLNSLKHLNNTLKYQFSKKTK